MLFLYPFHSRTSVIALTETTCMGVPTLQQAVSNEFALSQSPFLSIDVGRFPLTLSSISSFITLVRKRLENQFVIPIINLLNAHARETTWPVFLRF